MTDTVRATVYLQVQPELSRYNWEQDTLAGVKGAKIVGFTQKKAQRPRGGTVEVKITIELPKAAFLPLRPEAVIVVPESMTQPHPVEVEALHANEGEAD